MESVGDLNSENRVGKPVSSLTVLGLETSCDETAASVVRLTPDGTATVLSSVVHSQIDDHAAFGGVVPEIAARSHVEMIDGVVRRAMAEAGLGYSELDGVAATAGPGLVGGVMVGLGFGKAVALARGLPLVAVNHLEGHAVSARLGARVAYPFLLLLVSGGHCQLLEVRGIGDMSRLGTTIDDAAGEAFDKIAKALGLGYPGGPALEQMAESGDGTRFDLPRALLGRKDCDFSFSGLKTAASRLAQTCETDQDRADLADAVQNAIARQLSERSDRAMAAYAETHDHRLFVVAGGVAYQTGRLDPAISSLKDRFLDDTSTGPAEVAPPEGLDLPALVAAAPVAAPVDGTAMTPVRRAVRDAMSSYTSCSEIPFCVAVISR